MRLQVFLFLLISFCLGFAPPAVAGEDLPEIAQGLWAMPDCAAPQKLAYHSETHVLYITDKDAVLSISTLIKTNPDYFVIQNGADIYPVRVSNDGIMEIGVLAEGYALDDRLPWEALPIDMTKQYLKCAIKPPLPHDIAPDALAVLDRLEHYCLYGANKSCLKAVFDGFDYDASGSVNQEEAVKAGIISLYLVPLLNYQPVTEAELMLRLKDAYPVSVAYTATAFKLLDTDLSGELTIDELDYAPPLLSPDLQEFAPYDAMVKIMSLYPKLYQ